MPVNALPNELLSNILDEFRPVYNIHFVEDGAHKAQPNPKNWSRYIQILVDFAQLRLVCKRWDSFVTPLLYSTYVLATRPEQDFERTIEGFKHYPHLIDRLVIRGHVGPWHAVQNGVAEVLAACLACCTNLKQLEILDPHRIFWHIGKGKAYAVFQSIPPHAPFQSLSLYFTQPGNHQGYAFGVSTPFVGLGRRTKNLTDLKVIVINHSQAGERVNSSEAVHFPSEMPNLKTLSLQGGIEADFQLPKLLSRICRKGQGTSPLRELTLSRMRGFVDPRYMERILSINDLGRNLTVLQLRLPPWSYGGLGPAVQYTKELPFTLFKCCPALETFIYLTHCPINVLRALPSDLHTFGVRIEPRSTISWTEAVAVNIIHDSQPLVELVRNQKMRKKIRTLIIEWGNTFHSSKHRGKRNSKILRDACEAHGVEYTEKVPF